MKNMIKIFKKKIKLLENDKNSFKNLEKMIKKFTAKWASSDA